MAKSKRYRITLHKASLRPNGMIQVSLSYTIGADGARKSDPEIEVECAGLPAVLAAVDKFAAEHGKPCLVYVRCLDKPAPPGFDKATRRLYRNLGNNILDTVAGGQF